MPGDEAAEFWLGQVGARNWSPILQEIPSWKYLRWTTPIELIVWQPLMNSQLEKAENILYKTGGRTEF
jgi:hypothetical protein